MAAEPIDTTGSMYVSTPCVTGCGQWVIAIPEHQASARCELCLRAAVGAEIAVFPPPAHWFSANNPVPPPAEYEMGPNLTPFADVDHSRVSRCLRCGEEWPMIVGLPPEAMVCGFADHDRVAHTDGVWLVGGPGGADEAVCAPCGGGDREKRPLPGGPDHGKCLKGQSRGWGGRCGCRHRSRADLDAIVGKNRRGWRPNRWSDPKIVEIAAENVKNRWNQLNLWEERQ